jgi:hypothetical protein
MIITVKLNTRMKAIQRGFRAGWLSVGLVQTYCLVFLWARDPLRKWT